MVHNSKHGQSGKELVIGQGQRKNTFEVIQKQVEGEGGKESTGTSHG